MGIENVIDHRKYMERQEGVFSAINIVPFTDIILVLLIVFMIAAPGLARFGMGIDLPQARTDDADFATHINLVLDKRGELYLEGSPYSAAELKREIGALLKKRRDLAVTISADRQSLHGRVVEIMDIVREVGVKKIYVGTSRK